MHTQPRPRRPLVILCSTPTEGSPPDRWQVGSIQGRRRIRIERALRGPSEVELVKVVPLKLPKITEERTEDWREILVAITDGLKRPNRSKWVKSADALTALKLRSGRPRHRAGFLAGSRNEKWLNIVDEGWSKAGRISAAERSALFYAVEHWDEARGGIRFRSRPLAVALRRLLVRSGFSEDELRLDISGRFDKLTSSEIHEVIETDSNLPGTAARRGWRGSIMISFQGNTSNARQFRSAAHFLLLFLAIREGYGL